MWPRPCRAFSVALRPGRASAEVDHDDKRPCQPTGPRRAAPHGGPETFVVWGGCGSGRNPLPDEEAADLCCFCLDGVERVMPESETDAFLAAEFARRGWSPTLIWVSYERVPLPGRTS